MKPNELPNVVELQTSAGKTMFVETRDVHIARSPRDSNAIPDVKHLPEGSRPVGAHERLAGAIEGVSELIDAAAEIVGQALNRHSPAEFEVELNVGFTGKTQPIPFLVAAEADASLKITITWKRGNSE
jgi:Trypsin-co-occurring domain 1